ncbi:MAG: IS1595 family transposase [Terracidiphilus sp.]
MTKQDRKHQLSDSPIVDQIPVACSNELAAVEFLEGQRWGANPCCVKCGSVAVYKMADAKTGERNARFLWRCRDCKEQYTVRIGTVYEESRIELRHWCYTFWRAATSKKGVSALEIKRHCQISYKSALFLMNRIRFAMAPNGDQPKLTGIVEADETFVGDKARNRHVDNRKTKKEKTIVFAAVQRGGEIRRKIIPNVTGWTLKGELKKVVDPRAKLMTDDYIGYKGSARFFRGGHQRVRHSIGQYAKGDVTTNTVESSHALLKRSIVGIYHNVSSEYLHRYIWQADFLWNNRKMNDGERTVRAIKSAEGKRMMYKQPAA